MHAEKNIEFILALDYYYLQLLNCLLCHSATDPFGLQIFIVTADYHSSVS